MNVSVTDSTIPTMKRRSSSGVHSLAGFMLVLTCVYKIFGAVPRRHALGFLALFDLPVVGVLAIIPKAVFATHEGQSRKG
jgi:hypothetical protein